MEAVVLDRPIAVSVKRAAAMLGLSHWTVRAYAKSGKLRVSRLGRRVLVPVAALEKLVKESEVPL